MKNVFSLKKVLFLALFVKQFVIDARICPSLTRKVTSLDGVTKLAITTVVSATKINEITANNLMCYLNKSTLLDIKQIKDQRILIQTKVYYELFYST